MRSIAFFVAITLALLLTASVISSSFASPDPGRETDNVPVGPVTVPSVPVNETQTQICPDGTEISIVMECPNPPNAAGCPPNQLVIITEAGDCIAVPQPFTCPDGVLAPTAEQCNDPSAPVVLPLAPAPPVLPPQEVTDTEQSQLVDTLCGPIDPSKGFCHNLPQDPNKPTAAEEAERAAQQQQQEEEEGDEQDSPNNDGDNGSDNDSDGEESGGSENDGGEEGSVDEGGETD